MIMNNKKKLGEHLMVSVFKTGCGFSDVAIV